jgi:putative inorganic carbon (HCO3(-)) transporter
MAYWQEALRLKQRSGNLVPSMMRVLRSSRYGDTAFQWAIVVGVGFVLGAYTIALGRLPSKWAVLSALVVVAPFVAMIVGQVRKLLLGAIAIDIPLQLDSFFAYREGVIGGAIPGFIVSVTTLCLVGLYGLWLAELLAKRSKVQGRPVFALSFPLIAYVFFGVLSTVAARDVQLALFAIFLFVQMLLLYVYIVGTVTTREDVLFITVMLMVGLALEGLIMMALRATGSGVEVGGVINARIDDGDRVGGTVGGPNSAAAYLSLLLAPALGLILARVGRWYKLLGGLAFSLGTIGLLLTLSRGGWLAFFLSVGLVSLLAWRRGWLSAAVPIIAVILILILVFVFQDVFLGRLLGDDAGSSDSRIPLLTIAFRMVMDNPAFGVGINNFTVRILEYADLETANFWLFAVHNNFLLIWSETGTAAFIAYVAFLTMTLYRGWRCWTYADRTLSPLALGLTVGILGHMVHMLFDLFNGRGPVQMLWFSAALVAAMYCILNEAHTSVRAARTDSASCRFENYETTI